MGSFKPYLEDMTVSLKFKAWLENMRISLKFERWLDHGYYLDGINRQD